MIHYYYANIPAEDNIYLQSECPNNLTDISVNQLIQYSIDKQYINNDFEQPNFRGSADGSFGGNSNRFTKICIIIRFKCYTININYCKLCWYKRLLYCIITYYIM